MKLQIDNQIVLIDDEDFDKIKHIKWRIEQSKCQPYVKFRTTDKNRKTMAFIMHRIIMNIEHLSWKEVIVDHINGNTLDNRKYNLRLANHNTNQYNTKKSIKNTTGYRGVDWRKQEKKYRVRVSYNGKRITIGWFHDIREAAKAYNEAAIKYHGEFAKLNDIT